jgi:hypothetical protein
MGGGLKWNMPALSFREWKADISDVSIFEEAMRLGRD